MAALVESLMDLLGAPEQEEGIYMGATRVCQASHDTAVVSADQIVLLGNTSSFLPCLPPPPLGGEGWLAGYGRVALGATV